MNGSRDCAWTAVVLTLFPEMFPGPLMSSVLGRALNSNLWKICVVDIKKFGIGKWKKVDDTPYGGGPGQILSPEPLGNAIDYANKTFKVDEWIYMSASGDFFCSKMANKFVTKNTLGIMCGRYEGIDRRIVDFYHMKEVCVSNAVVSGGEIPAMFVIDAVVRLIDGVLGNPDSVSKESLSEEMDCEYPQYTRPSTWHGVEVPPVLLSGNHERIANWRKIAASSMSIKRSKDD